MSRKLMIAIAVLLVLAATGALADGMIFPVERPNSTIVVPDQLFTVKYHRVDVSIQDQLCTTKVDQIFHNDSSVDREGMYVFPMPLGSAITKFSMYAGEEEILGRIMDRAEARSIYESIVRQRKDPAILEYIDRNTFRARVYPIPANGDKRIRLSYAEVANRTGSLCRYVYPLSTERFSARPLEECRVTIKIKCKRSITSVYSPTHQIDVERPSATEAVVKWSAKDTRPDTDMVIYYSVSDNDVGIDLVAHRERGEDGYYMLLASPRVEVDKSKVQPKNVLFVLDRTGSMAGEKIDQAKDALKFCLNSLKDKDRFNVITFNETPDPMYDGLQNITPERRRKALEMVGDLDATGGTDINRALTLARKQFEDVDSSRNYVVFITDGLPTVGDTNIENILRNAKNPKAKIFAFGVGYDVNTHLLDKLAEQNRGSSDYVRPRENIEVKISSFFSKVSDPLLSDISLEITGIKTTDSYPNEDLPDIFSGSQLLVLGRYTGSGTARITLTGTAGSEKRKFRLSAELPKVDEENEYIPQLWAARKIGYLLDEIRLHSNKELVDEVVRLSKKYGIPTEYTSFLADERMTEAKLKTTTLRIRSEAEEASRAYTGSSGVAQSTNANASKYSAQAPAMAPMPGGYGGGGYGGGANGGASAGTGAPQVLGNVAANGRVGGTYQDSNDRTVVVANVQNIAGRTFYQRGNFWEDSGLKPAQNAIQIKQFSDAHFRLLKAYPKLAQYSTLGNVRVIMANNQAVEIGPEGKDKLTDAELKSLLSPDTK